MRPWAPLLLLVTGCMTARRPPPPLPPEPRFSLAAERQSDPEMCRRMADWDCLGLDCPDCAKVAEGARKRDVLEILGTLGALGLASSAHWETVPTAPSNTPFADALHSGSEPVNASDPWSLPATRAERAAGSCRIVCRRCASAKERCRQSGTLQRE